MKVRQSKRETEREATSVHKREKKRVVRVYEENMQDKGKCVLEKKKEKSPIKNFFFPRWNTWP